MRNERRMNEVKKKEEDKRDGPRGKLKEGMGGRCLQDGGGLG